MPWSNTMSDVPGELLDGLANLGLRTPHDAFRAFLSQAAKQRLGPVQLLEQLVALERRERDGRNLMRRTRTAKLGKVTPLDQFDWSHPQTIDRARIEHLLSLDFVKTGENVLLRGPSGVGKTTLATYLGLEALRFGYTVLFCTFAEALAELLKQESLPALERRLRRYTTPTLLIIDEIGYLPCDNAAADILFNIVSRRHESRSIVITTNLSFKQWGPLFAGAACVAALVDRFAQHCHTIDIVADSWRQKHALAQTAPDTSPRSTPAPRRRAAKDTQ
jgi:DNA replication protein DnaC